MTTISAKVIADSVNDAGNRLTTMMLRYPRVIHAEFMTHRQFSRNASSSRAIPVERLIKDIIDDPFIPLHWGKNQRGMQAHKECNNPITLPLPEEVLQRMDPYELSKVHEALYGKPALTREEAWSYALARAIQTALAFNEAGYHKQLVNRLVEPFAHINVLVTATEWSNFFALRLHEDAEPHINLLAFEMKKALDESKPTQLRGGSWHLPFITDSDFALLYKEDSWERLKQISVARCARVSYLTHDGREPNFDEDKALHDRLMSAVPLHASPAEHVCTPYSVIHTPEMQANLRGWVSYRKYFANECAGA